MDHYKAFLRAWLDFAENHDNNPSRIFSIRSGLCPNCARYDWSRGSRASFEDSTFRVLKSRLRTEIGDSNTPFNDALDVSHYEDELDKTKNPHRLAFVRKELGL